MPRASIGCLLRGELRKIIFQRTNWVLPVAAFGLGILAATAAGDTAPSGLNSFQLALDTYRAFAAAAIGVMMVGTSAQLVAAEYQWATVRVVTGRGVGRLRLLSAKLAAVLLVAVPLLVLLGGAGAADVAVRAAAGSTPAVWSEVWLSAIVVAMSAVVCAVLGAAAGAVGRSITFALAVVAGFFPADNILGYVLPIIQNATQEQFWANATTYLLGPTLNHLPAVLIGRPAAELVVPELPIDLAHSLVVIAGYTALLVIAAAIVTSRRDITS